MIHVDYYLCMTEDGKRTLFQVDPRNPHDMILLLQGMNRLRCHECFTYEEYNEAFMTTQPPIYPTSPLIPTISCDTDHGLTIPRLCSHNLQQIQNTLALITRFQPDPPQNNLPHVYLERIKISADDKVKILEMFKNVTLSYIPESSTGVDGLNDFIDLLELCEYNFEKIHVENYDHDDDFSYGVGFTMHNETLYAQSLVPNIFKFLDRNRKLTRVIVEDVEEFTFMNYINVLQKPVQVSYLEVDQFSSHMYLGATVAQSMIGFLSVFKSSLQKLAYHDDDAVEIMSEFFKAEHVWPLLRRIDMASNSRYDRLSVLPSNRCNFPLLTEVYFIENNLTYEANPKLIDRLSGETYEAYREELYLFLVYNRRNYIAAHCWEVIAKNYLAKPYRINKDIRELIFKLIIGADTTNFGYVEPPISLHYPEIYHVKCIKSDNRIRSLSGDMVYCFDDAIKKKWHKAKIIHRKATHHRKSRLQLEKDLSHKDSKIEQIRDDAEAKIKRLKVEVRDTAEASIQRLERRSETKRKRLETLETYQKKLKASLDELLE